MGGGGDSHWCGEAYASPDWRHLYTNVELLLLLLMVPLALGIEVLLHHLRHFVQRSYAYGLPHQKHDGRGPPKPRRLYADLLERSIGELTILGFVALVIFVGNQCGLFDTISASAKNMAPHHTIPDTPGDWFHMFEFVHVDLFIGMVVYFGGMFIFSIAANRTMQKLETLEAKRIGIATPSVTSPAEQGDYAQLRTFFIERVLRWRDTRPTAWAALLKCWSVEEEDGDVSDSIRDWLEEDFVVCDYIALCVQDSMSKAIEVTPGTWAGILSVVVFMRTVGFFSKMSLQEWQWVFVAAGYALMTVVIIHLRRTKARVRNHEVAATSSTPTVVAAKTSTSTKSEAFKMKFQFRQHPYIQQIQAWQFLMSYAIARSVFCPCGPGIYVKLILDPRPLELVSMAVFFSLCALLTYGIYKIFPQVWLYMALSPCQTKQSFQHFLQLCEERRMIRQDPSQMWFQIGMLARRTSSAACHPE